MGQQAQTLEGKLVAKQNEIKQLKRNNRISRDQSLTDRSSLNTSKSIGQKKKQGFVAREKGT